MITRSLAQLTREALYTSRPSTVRWAVMWIYILMRVLMPAAWLSLVISWWS